MKILVVGASSYVGARIYADLKDYFEVIGTYSKNKLFQELVELDITNRDQAIQIIEGIRPSIIIHIAAIPTVAAAKGSTELLTRINVEGTKNIVNAANAVGAKVIFVSSFAAIKPVDAYGESKKIGEEIVKTAKQGFVILRPSLIVGVSPNTTNDRPFNRILKNITHKTPPVYDNSWRFQPTLLNHISEVIQKIIEKDINNEIIPICVPELKTRFEVARDILSYFSIDAIESDTKDTTTPVFKDNLDKLRQLGLPQYTYSQMISKIIEELKQSAK